MGLAKDALRIAGSVVAGVLLWTVLWFAFTTAAKATFPGSLVEGQPIQEPQLLAMYIGMSALLSVVAGFTTARLAKRRVRTAVWLLALIQQSLGILAELSYWALMPGWYHAIFLSLILPMTVAGGELESLRVARVAPLSLHRP